MRSLYESIIDSDEIAKSKVADEVELFNATVRSTFHEVFKDFLDFSSGDYSSFYLTYKLKNQNLSDDKAIEEYNKLIDTFIRKLRPLYRLDVVDKSDQQDEIQIVFNKTPKELKRKIGAPIYVYVSLNLHLPSHFKKMIIWISEDYMYNMFEEPRN